MTHRLFGDILTYTEPLICAIAIVLIYVRRLQRKFDYLVALLGARVGFFVFGMSVIRLAGTRIEQHLAYKVYFYSFWSSYAVESVLGFLVIYGVYKLAMEPLPGLQRLGKVMFRWAGGLSLALAVSTAFGPHVNGTDYAIRLIQELQQTQSVLALGMLFFVCVTIKPMGLSWKSKIFGVTLGLGLLSTVQLVESAWFSNATSLYSVINIVNGLSACVTLLIWTGYMAMPEPKRRMIILPTTSPFFHWNEISAILGDAPGFATVGEVTQDMLDPTEVHMMRRAAARMTETHFAA